MIKIFVPCAIIGCLIFCAGEEEGGLDVYELTNENEINICFPSPDRPSIYLKFALSYTTIPKKYGLKILVVQNR